MRAGEGERKFNRDDYMEINKRENEEIKHKALNNDFLYSIVL
jgi:hypothetical protein